LYKTFPGILLCLLIAVPAWFLGQLLPITGGAVTGLLLGMLLAGFWRYPAIFIPGIRIASKRILQAAIILLGFQMNLGTVAQQGGKSLFLIFSAITTALLISFIIGKILGTAANETILIGVGTAICGGSAIAAVSPVIEAKDSEVASAVSVIFLFNIIAVVIFPALGRLIGMDDGVFGAWAGAAINDTSSVVAASYSYSGTAGDTATIIKLTRTLFIIPVTLGLALIRSKKGSGSRFNPRKAFPLFIAFFVIACVINASGLISGHITSALGSISKFMIVIAMTAIGLGTNLKSLARHGKKPILLGLCCWVSVAAVTLLIVNLT